ncbi:MAG: hypothetical protein JSV12_05290 [Candidatus Bathyarchaeota archaeon]|nr:MAG: hypothetical protein JSV12_05290 [Candidatus Bathyarchaeota archaeon]
MKVKTISGIMVILLLTSMLMLTFKIEPVSAMIPIYPTIYVDPPSIIDPTLTPGKNFTISIKTDYNGSDITGYDFVLYYNPSVIHAVSITNGDLIVGGTAQFIPGTPDNTNGKISAGAFFFSMGKPVPITSGPGTLANVTFTVVGIGDSPIILGTGMEETSLKGYTDDGYGVEYDIINGFTGAEHLKDGYFNNIPPPIHDVAVTNLDVPATATLGDIVSINVTVANEGNFTETFNLTCYTNPTEIGTQSVTNLGAGNQTTLTFSWNTTGLNSGTYTVTAEAILDGDSEPEDNIASKSIELKTLAITAVVDGKPNTLNLKSQGKWITCYIELPEGYNVGDIDVYSIELNNTFPVSLLVNHSVPVPTKIGDYDNDSIPDLMVKFNRTTLTAHIYHTLGIIYGNVTLTITGSLTDETMFEGSDTVKVKFGGDADLNGLVELDDFDIWLDNFGKKSNKCPPGLYPDFNSDEYVDMLDFFVWRENFGANVPPQP